MQGHQLVEREDALFFQIVEELSQVVGIRLARVDAQPAFERDVVEKALEEGVHRQVVFGSCRVELSPGFPFRWIAADMEHGKNDDS